MMKMDLPNNEFFPLFSVEEAYSQIIADYTQKYGSIAADFFSYLSACVCPMREACLQVPAPLVASSEDMLTDIMDEAVAIFRQQIDYWEGSYDAYFKPSIYLAYDYIRRTMADLEKRGHPLF